MTSPSVLVVEPRPLDGRVFGTWLEEDGYTNVMICPGPGAPDYTCLATKSIACPLSNAADIVVVDMQQRSDDAMSGIPGWMLMLYYFDQGKRIVAITGPDDPVCPTEDDRICVIRRPPTKTEFMRALRAMSRRIKQVGAVRA